MKYLHLLPFVVTALWTSTTAVAASSPECGVVGYDKGNPTAYYFDGSGLNANFAACSALCKANSCVSFAFGNGDCLLYSASVASDVNPTKGSPYTFYDASCLALSAVTSSTTSSLSSRTSSTLGTTTSTTTTSSSTLVTTTSTTTTSSSTLGTTTSTTTTNSGTSDTTTNTTSNSTSSPTSTTTSSSMIKSTTTSTSLTSTTLMISKISSTSSSTTSSSTTTSSSATSTPPCPAGPWTVSNFVWFNSTHNLDCGGGGAEAGSSLCDTGMPEQPPGYGPPDTLNFDVSQSVPSGANCTLWNARNPGSVPIYEIGTGGCGFRCEGNTTLLWVLTYFLGDSTKAQSEATINLMGEDITCPDGTMYTGYGSATFPISCTYDAGNNATCVSTTPTFEVAMTSW